MWRENEYNIARHAHPKRMSSTVESNRVLAFSSGRGVGCSGRLSVSISLRAIVLSSAVHTRLERVFFGHERNVIGEDIIISSFVRMYTYYPHKGKLYHPTYGMSATAPTRVCVRGLAKEVTEEDLKLLASKCGIVWSVQIMRSEFDGESRGFGFVTMSSHEGLEKFVKTYNKAIWRGGRRLCVEAAKADYRERLREEWKTAEEAKQKRRQRDVDTQQDEKVPLALLNGIPRPTGKKVYLIDQLAVEQDATDELARAVAAEENLSLSIFRDLLSKEKPEQKSSLSDEAPPSPEHDTCRELVRGVPNETDASLSTSQEPWKDESSMEPGSLTTDNKGQWTALRDVFSAAPVKVFADGLSLSFAASGGQVDHKFSFALAPGPAPSPTPNESQPAALSKQRPTSKLQPSLWADLEEAIEEGRRFVRNVDVGAVKESWESKHTTLTRTYRRLSRRVQARKRRRTF